MEEIFAIVTCPYCTGVNQMHFAADTGNAGDTSRQEMVWCSTCDQAFAARLRIVHQVDALPLWGEPVTQEATATATATPNPDWSTAPDWAQWWAMDKNRKAFFYECRPVLCFDVWWSSPTFRAEDGPGSLDWRTSLRQRPEAA